MCNYLFKSHFIVLTIPASKFSSLMKICALNKICEQTLSRLYNMFTRIFALWKRRQTISMRGLQLLSTRILQSSSLRQNSKSYRYFLLREVFVWWSGPFNQTGATLWILGLVSKVSPINQLMKRSKCIGTFHFENASLSYIRARMICPYTRISFPTICY